MLQGIDEDLIKQIRYVVAEDVNNVKEMKRHLHIYVKNERFRNQVLPPSNNRRFFPKSNDIRNHMYLALMTHRLAKVDQENLQLLVPEWKKSSPQDDFLFDSYKDDVTPSSNEE